MILGSDKKQYYSKNNSAARSLGRCIDEMYKKKQLPFPVSAITYGENAVIIVPITQEEFDEKRKKKKEKKKD